MMHRSYLAVRRIVDVLVAGILIVALIPLFAAVAAAVRLTMGRPIFFRQARCGHRGEFRLLKFRTMVNGAERLGGGYMAAELDLIPPLGRLLRKSSLDELPQLVNILKGDMSFVGPRPALPSQVSRYTSAQRMRLIVPQGVTGLAQVRYRNEAPWSVRITADLEYIREFGAATDLRILLATIVRVLRGSGVRSDQTASEVDDLPSLQADDEKE